MKKQINVIYKILLLIPVAAVNLATAIAWADGDSSTRTAAIVSAFNSMPWEIETALKADQVHLSGGEGRVDVNPSVKFSYYVQILKPSDVQSTITLIPMATSRYTPAYYSTDEWWDANKAKIEEAKTNGTPIPKQDQHEVEVWLNQKKLSTDPYVLQIEPATGAIGRTRLQDFLREHIVNSYQAKGYVTLYRGGERDNELTSWQRGEIPKGARYWTPTANYAWRYARKNSSFLSDLVEGKAPLFVFRVPVNEFKEMTQTSTKHPRFLTLGTELTKNAHQAFDSMGKFTDHLYNSDYAGEGELGVEIEVRSTRGGAQMMSKYFVGPISVEELARDRILNLKRAQDRMVAQELSDASQIRAQMSARIERTMAEARLLYAIREKMSSALVQRLWNELPGGHPEISNNDYQEIDSFVQDRLGGLPSKSEMPTNDELNARMKLTE
jgi:hypothetical protein